MKKLFLFVLLSYTVSAQSLSKRESKSTTEYHLYVGTYTLRTSEGIYVYRFNPQIGDFAPAGVAKGIKNPSFLAISPNQQFLYAAEGKSGESVRSFSIDRQSGQLTLLNVESSGGLGPTHLMVDKTGKWLLVGNYTAGSLSCLPIQQDGRLGKAVQTIQHTGSSLHPERQREPHVHSVNLAPNNRDLFVPDLGTDKIMTYLLNDQTGQLTPGSPPFTTVEPSSGPRHFDFHPNGRYAYVIQEMGGLITGFRYKPGELTPFQTVKTLPDDYTGLNTSADIHISPDGRFLYGSNRGHESLVIYSIDSETGQLTYVGHQSVNGKTPRNFTIDPTGNYVLVANQDTDNITLFKRDHYTGKLTPTGKEISVSMPVCLKWLPAIP
ncbi:lactonase family protein [Nibrella saemangeumensis]|uniref:Lactonase family protein n=1 Tax=Nibrella saemangeumensis TaxID=1084526 RepID=A0ABP8MTJ2_9BACT